MIVGSNFGHRSITILLDLDQLQRNQNEKQFIEIGFKSLIEFWVTFFLPTILVYYNNIIRVHAKCVSVIPLAVMCLFSFFISCRFCPLIESCDY
jgi:hypothetical protein